MGGQAEAMLRNWDYILGTLGSKTKSDIITMEHLENGFEG
jgi:hypothetical protein